MTSRAAKPCYQAPMKLLYSTSSYSRRICLHDSLLLSLLARVCTIPCNDCCVAPVRDSSVIIRSICCTAPVRYERKSSRARSRASLPALASALRISPLAAYLFSACVTRHGRRFHKKGPKRVYNRMGMCFTDRTSGSYGHARRAAC